MRSFTFKFLSFAVTCMVLIITTSSQCKKKPQIVERKTNAPGFAVMELFTSQGCSSCPPADNLLAKYAAKKDDNIIALAFHVDYWNRLGWTDSFSSAKYSKHQRDYAMMIDNSSVYTPQLIINGTKEFVGSDDEKISGAVENALKDKPALSVSINKTERIGDKIAITCELDRTIDHTILLAALIQKKSFTNILKGENKGLKQMDINIVRDFVSVHINSKTSVIDLHMPMGHIKKDFAVVIYVQEDATGKIIAALKRNL